MILPTLSLTEQNALDAFRAFLIGLVSNSVSVIKGQINRVPEPLNPDFIIFWPINQKRLSTNETTYQDNIIFGYIDGPILTVTAVIRGQITPGMSLIDKGWPVNFIAADTFIVNQIDGTPGGVGTYTVFPSQFIFLPVYLLDDAGNAVLDDNGKPILIGAPGETLFAGVRSDLTPTELTVQLDMHGPSSGDTVRIIESLFRSEYGTSSIESSGYSLSALYCEDARQTPFINAEQQYEYRWTIDAHLQINPTVGTPQQFADQIQITLEQVDVPRFPVVPPIYLLDDSGNIVVDDNGRPIRLG